MNAETYRELEEALEVYPEMHGSPYEFTECGVVEDAARRDLSRWELCPECGGSGFTTGHSGSDGIAVTCSRCQGSGVIPNQARLEAGRQALSEDDRWLKAPSVIEVDADHMIEIVVRAFDQTGEPE